MAEIAKVRYNHDAMIDLIISTPWIKQNDIAAHFGMSVGWISQVISSDAFKMRLAERKAELIDPTIIMTFEEELESLGRLSRRVIAENLEASKNPVLAVEALKIAAKASGLGARGPATAIQNNVVVMVPAKNASSDEWAQAHAPLPPALKAG